MVDVDLSAFAAEAAASEEELDLARAALAIAAPEYPGLDVAHYLGIFDYLASRAKAVLAHPSDEAALVRVARMLHEDCGFVGNDSNYYDPRNSFLNEVLDRRTGIPITLAIVLIEVARRVGISAFGVGFPGHFLVRAQVGDVDIVVDPFTGLACDRKRLRDLTAQATGARQDPDPRFLQPLTKRLILTRMLNNLRGIYSAATDSQRLRGVVERLQILEALSQRSSELN